MFQRSDDRWQALVQRRRHRPPPAQQEVGDVELQSLSATAATIWGASMTAPHHVRQRVGLPGALAAEPL